jgi:hypothetical protein
MLLDPAAERVDSFSHFFGVVVVCEEVAAGFAGEGGARGDGGWVARVGGELGFEGFDEVLEGGLLVRLFFFFYYCMQ